MTADDVTGAARFRSLMQQVSLFDGLSEESLALLADNASLRTYVAGERVIEHGAAISSLFVVASGMLAASVPDRHGTMTEVARFGAGQYCGEMSLIRGERASSAVEAVTDSLVWLLPHRVIGDVADREPTIMRALASEVASRLSDTNQRIQQLRPGHAVACISHGSQWARAAVAQIALSGSRHLTRPVLLVDLTADAHALSGFGNALPSVAELVADEGLLGRFEAAANDAAPSLAISARGEGFELDTARLLAILERARRLFPLVVVHVPDVAALDDPLFEELDGPVLLWAEDEDIGSLQGARRFAEGDTVLLRPGLSAPTVGELRALGERRNANVLRVIPAGAEILQNVRPADAIEEPWESIDWLARHFIKRKVGLALGAGGAKGYAHLGVMQRLRAFGIPVDFTAGASIGAPLAAGIADRRNIDEMRSIMDGLFRDALKPTSLRLPWNALTSNRALTRGFEELADGRTFQDLRIPVAVVAANVTSKKEVVFTEGDPVAAMLASFAIPGIFPPVEIDGQLLVDGGFLNPVPVDTVANLGADVVIGVELNEPQETAHASRTRRRWPPYGPPIITTLSQTFEMIMWKLNTETSSSADVSIVPHFATSVSLSDYKEGDTLIEAGRVATDAVHNELQELLPWIS